MAALAGPVNINTADAATLARELKGVGPPRRRPSSSTGRSTARSARRRPALVKGIGQKLLDRNRANMRLDAGAVGAGRRPPGRRPRRQAGAGRRPAVTGDIAARGLPGSGRQPASRPAHATACSRRSLYHGLDLSYRGRACQVPDQDGRVPGRRPRHALPAGHQGQPEGDAADRRQAADPVRGRRGAGGRRRRAGVHHRLLQACHRGPFRHRPGTREGARVAGQAASCSTPVRSVLPSLCHLHLHPPAGAAGPGPRRAVRAAGRGRRAVLRAPRGRPDRRRGGRASSRWRASSTSHRGSVLGVEKVPTSETDKYGIVEVEADRRAHVAASTASSRSRSRRTRRRTSPWSAATC